MTTDRATGRQLARRRGTADGDAAPVPRAAVAGRPATR